MFAHRLFTLGSAAALAAASLLGSCSSPSGNADTAANGAAGAATADSSTANSAVTPTNSPLQVVAEFNDPQMVGVAVAPGGQVFACFPRWDWNPSFPIAKVGSNSTLTPYPNASWCTWNDSVKSEPLKHWICPQSVFADKSGMVWVLDPASPGLKFTVPGGPKLVKTDPKTGQVLLTIPFSESVAPRKSYLNDVRIDLQNNYAYMTESGIGALVVTDLKTLKSRRLLANHPSTKAVKGLVIKAEGHPMLDLQGKPAQFNADGIALSTDNAYLYYCPLTGHTLYRIKTAALRDAALTEAQLGQQVETVGEIPGTDGLEIDAANNVYLTSFEQSALLRRTPAGKIETLVKDPGLQWPDTYSFGADGTLYVTNSAIHKTPNWNKGVGQPRQPFRIFKMALPK
ncbi:SMP-30/gluconolactonase/LRE family protein [Hymenobacter convexus]|uniref:SMP-30/gluconolactonase/LRE family protein n=1 Tax=Hymenobacter sp. CA1UV-4 TaxID=3063782 RepID=UPI002712BFDA|nr:L-dopachrome tautomerase-related protein [Hymenobacter sp. CA1UV-4]MDO7850593.1 L-dopachrome tautomerase-related protein [Hymenobacter sp. CA1UV-4]